MKTLAMIIIGGFAFFLVITYAVKYGVKMAYTEIEREKQDRSGEKK